MEQLTLKQKLLKVRKELSVGYIKELENSFFKSSYADINAILKMVDPVLNENGLLLTQPVFNRTIYTIIECVDSGQTVESSMKMQKNLSAHEAGSAITYYRRYTLVSLLSLRADDDDGNGATGGWLKRIKDEANKRFKAGTPIDDIEQALLDSKTVHDNGNYRSVCKQEHYTDFIEALGDKDGQ